MTNKQEKHKVKIECLCRHCGNYIPIEVYMEDYDDYLDGIKPHVQDAFPYLTPAERELFISATCGDCWNKMFNPLTEE